MGFGVQRIYIVPSRDLVVVRLGESPSSEAHAAGAPFDDQMWKKIMKLFFSTSTVPGEDGGYQFDQVSTKLNSRL